jgi:hypothetical protein
MVIETHETRRKLNLFSGACRTGKLHVGRYVMLNSSPGVCCMFHQIAEGRRGVGVMTAAKPKAVGGTRKDGSSPYSVHSQASRVSFKQCSPRRYLSPVSRATGIIRCYSVATAFLQAQGTSTPHETSKSHPHQRHRPHLLQAQSQSQSQSHTLSRAPGIVTSLYNSTSADKSTPAGPSGSRRKDRCSAPTTPSLRIVNVD